MTLVAKVTLPRGRYDAATSDPLRPESVPSPYRLFCALVASSARDRDPRDDQALRWLETQDPPTITVPEVLDHGRDDAFVVTNRSSAKGGSMTHPGRVNRIRRRAWVTFRGPAFWFCWAETPDADLLASLRRLASGITYLGRVETPARVELSANEPDDGDLRTFEMAELGQPGTEVPVPYSGATDALVDAHERGDHAWETTRTANYSLVEDEPDTDPARSPFDGFMTFRLLGEPVDGSRLLEVTTALREAVMSCVKKVAGKDHIPPSVHGHVRDQVHVAYLGLPFVGHRQADGRLRGVALALPSGLPESDRATLAAALQTPANGAGLTRIQTKGRARNIALEVVYEALPQLPWSIRDQRWTGPAAGQRTWVTATPIMLDRFPKSPEQFPRFVADACEQAGLPRPVHVETAETPLLPGTIAWHPTWRRWVDPKRPIRPVVHARIGFAERVRGPLLVGSLRYLGCGLLAPVDVALDAAEDPS